MESTKRALILNGSLTKAIYTLSLPIIVSSLIQTLYNLTDTYFVSRLGDTQMAAMQVTYPLVFLMISLGIGLSIGGVALISQYVGAGDQKNAIAVSGQLVSASFLIGTLTAFVGIVLSGHIMHAMGATGDLYAYAHLYLRIMFLGAPTLFIIFAFNGIKQGQGDMISPMIISALSVLMNIILDPIFIFTFNWGIAGAAYATVLSRFTFNVIAFILLFKKKHNPLAIHYSDLKLKINYLKRIVEVGGPAALAQATTSVGFIVMNSFVLSFGEQVVNAFAIGNRISGLIFMPAMGIGGALATIVGQNIGAGQTERADSAFKLSATHATIIISVGALIMLPFSENLIAFFSKNEYIISEGSFYLRMILLSVPLLGLFNCLIGLFQGSGHTKYVLLLNLGRLWMLRIPMLIAMDMMSLQEPKFIWYAMVLSNFIIVLIGYLIYKTQKWKVPVIKKRQADVSPEII